MPRKLSGTAGMAFLLISMVNLIELKMTFMVILKNMCTIQSSILGSDSGFLGPKEAKKLKT